MEYNIYSEGRAEIIINTLVDDSHWPELRYELEKKELKQAPKSPTQQARYERAEAPFDRNTNHWQTPNTAPSPPENLKGGAPTNGRS